MKLTTRTVLLSVMLICLSLVFYNGTLRPLARSLVELPQIPLSFLIPTLALWLFSLIHAAWSLGWRHMLIFFAVSAVVAWLFEQVGVETGLVYGPYHYTEELGARIGHVPILIPIAWFMMIYPSYVIANLMAGDAPNGDTPTGTRGGVGRVVWLSALSAMVMTAWDLTMDVWMSKPGPRQAWIWEQGGDYFGVPLLNFIGWLATTFTVYLIYRFVERKMQPQPMYPATPLINWLPLIAYAIMMIPSMLPTTDPQAIKIIALFVMGMPLLAASGRLAGQT